MLIMEKNIQKHIKTIRNILGYTQEELAYKLGISRAHLSQLEGDKVELSRTIAIALMSIIIYTYKTLDEDSVAEKLIGVYVEEFEKMILELV
jgi:DNA-binding XRE family transcriptional regulator